MSAEEAAVCGLCGREGGVVIHREGEWGVLRCRTCGHRYTHPRPTPERLAGYYTSAYFKDPSVFPDQSSKATPGLWRAMDVEDHLETRGRLLEVGAGQGTYLASMRLRGWSVDGVELSPDAVRIAKERHGLTLFCGGVETYSPVDSYDAICLYQCLEHLADPVTVLRRCRGWLRQGGIIVIEVPHAQSFDMLWSAERTRYSYDLPRHLHHFTPGSLARLLRQEGFQVAAIDRYLPKFALRLEEGLRAMRRRGTKAEQSAGRSAGVGPDADRTLPMMRRPAHWKATVERVASWLFPGWRFTIVARKV